MAKTHEANKIGLQNPETKDKIQNDSQDYFYLLTLTSRVLFEKLTAPQPVKKFPAFYGHRRFIVTFTILAPILSQINSVHAPIAFPECPF
jgi:hypothetical protein